MSNYELIQTIATYLKPIAEIISALQKMCEAIRAGKKAKEPQAPKPKRGWFDY